LTCGAPLDVQVRVETISQEIAPGVFTLTPVIVERWAYDSGPNAFVRHLTFRDGTLDDIELGGYGSPRLCPVCTRTAVLHTSDIVPPRCCRPLCGTRAGDGHGVGRPLICSQREPCRRVFAGARSRPIWRRHRPGCLPRMLSAPCRPLLPVCSPAATS